MNPVQNRLASRYGLEAAPLIWGVVFLVFLVGLALKAPSANIGAPGSREVRVL
jgi:hypothetical protein